MEIMILPIKNKDEKCEIVYQEDNIWCLIHDFQIDGWICAVEIKRLG